MSQGQQRPAGKPPRRIRFAALLLRYFGMMVAVVMLALGGFAWFGLGWLAVELSDEWGERTTQLVQYRAYHYIDGAGTVTRIVGGFQQSESDLGRKLTDDHQGLGRLMWAGLHDTASIETLYVADTEGNYVQVRREPELVTRLIDRRGTSDGKGAGRELWIRRDREYRILGQEQRDGSFDPRTRPWFAGTRPERITYWSEVFLSTTSRQPVLSVTFPVTRAGPDGLPRVTRVVGASVPLVRLNDFVRQARPTPGSLVLIVNQQGEVLANAIGNSSRPQLPDGRLARIDDLGIKGLAGAMEDFRQGRISPVPARIQGESFRAYFKPFGGYDWTTMVLIPDADSLGQLRELLWIALFVLTAVFFGTVIALMRLSRTLSLPLSRLADEAGNIRKFELESFVGVQSRIREIDQLNRALDSAVEALKGFKRYVPAELVRQLLKSPEFARVGGREAELTIMFTDIFEFTRLAEKLEPRELMNQVSEYLELMTGTIMKHGGTVDKYIGDAVMAFWGAPSQVEDGAGKACRAALECQALLVEMNARWAREGRPQLVTGIGINTARVVVGNFGSSDRLNYSLLGDGVNLTARLEKLNRQYDTRILVSQSTLDSAATPFATRLVDTVLVRGRSQGVCVHELLGEAGPGPVVHLPSPEAAA